MLASCVSLALCLPSLAFAYPSFHSAQARLKDVSSLGEIEDAWRGWKPTSERPIPLKVPWVIDEKVNFYEKRDNGSENGRYRRSSCPAMNTLANRGYIDRTGRNISKTTLTKAAVDVFNFGLDNILVVLGPTFALHPERTHIDLDNLVDDKMWHMTNCPAAPTRDDREIGDNVAINMTLFEALMASSKDGETLTFEDAAEHHHLRHNQSRADNPDFRFGNQDAICSLAQYGNLFGVLGRLGKNGLSTLYLDDVRQIYLKEDLPMGYARREMPYYSPEANAYIDRMAHHIGFQIQRPYPAGDQDGRDIEPVVAKFEQ